MKKFILGTVAASVLAFSGSAMANFVAGQDYQVLAKPVKVEKPGKIEVREFFWYGCGHCYTLEPHMQTWLIVPVFWGLYGVVSPFIRSSR